MVVHELHYSNTNTYLIEGEKGNLLFDTGWAGTFPAFCRALGEIGIPIQRIDHVLISHFHPDHMGIAQEIADQGAVILVPEVQRAFLHAADGVFEKEKNRDFESIRDDKVRFFDLRESRDILREIGVDGEILYTPGHSDDSISLWLDEGALFVGDLNPLYELELHKDTQIGKSWDELLKRNPKVVYYGHARKAVMEGRTADGNVLEERTVAGSACQMAGYQSEADVSPEQDRNLYALVSRIMKMIDKGYHLQKIQKKTGADEAFIEDVMRMYLTHQNIGIQGILDRIEIKNR